MARTENKTGMPLWIWVMAFMMALAILVITYFLLGIRDKHISGELLKMSAFSSQNNLRDSQVSMYFVGSSLTRHALIEHQTLDSAMNKLNRKFNYKTVVCNSGSLSSFDEKINEIKKLRPKYLFIEANIVCINMRGNFRERLARIPEYLMIMRGNAFKLVNNYAPDNLIEANNQKLDFDIVKGPQDIGIGEKFRIRKIDEFQEWDKLFNEAEQLGITIYLLEIPRSYEAEQLLPDKFKQQYGAIVKGYNNRFDIGYIECPLNLSRNKYFLDRAHFNRLGSQYYCEWLVKELCNRKILNCN